MNKSKQDKWTVSKIDWKMKLILFQNLNPLAIQNMHTVIELALKDFMDEDSDLFVCRCRTIVLIWEQFVGAYQSQIQEASNKPEFEHCHFCLNFIKKIVEKEKEDRTLHHFNLMRMGLGSVLKHSRADGGTGPLMDRILTEIYIDQEQNRE